MILSKIKSISSCYYQTKEDKVPNTSTLTINSKSSQPPNREMMTAGPDIQLVLKGFFSVPDQHLSHLSKQSRHMCSATGSTSELAAGTGTPAWPRLLLKHNTGGAEDVYKLARQGMS